MKIVIADIYSFNIHTSKKVLIPKRFKGYEIIWNFREALLELWKGNVTVLAMPELGTPGYDFPNFVQDMMEIGQIKSRPQFEYYKVIIQEEK